MEDCLFCKIVNKEIKSKIIFEDEKVLAFQDINPQAPVHILVIPKKHLATILDVKNGDKELIGHIYLTINEIVKKINLEERGFRVVVNCGEEAGQAVFHLHFHLLGGRKMLWPPG